jgi:hypothetical protein
MVGFTERARRAGATFLLFVGLFPVALAVLMIPFLNHVPFEEAIARSWFTSGAALAGNPGGLCSHAGRRLCACVCARRLQQRPRACCVRAQRLLTDADLAGVEHHAREMPGHRPRLLVVLENRHGLGRSDCCSCGRAGRRYAAYYGIAGLLVVYQVAGGLAGQAVDLNHRCPCLCIRMPPRMSASPDSSKGADE